MRISKLVVFSLLFFIALTAQANQTIRVALTSIQPPFVFDDAIRSGLVQDLVTEMNRSQNKFNFVLDLYPASRVVKDHKRLKIDLIAFNDLRWGWEKQGAKGSKSLTNGRDVFFSFPNNSHDAHKLAAVRGFHYKFAAFDPANLENNPDVHLLENEADVIKFLSYGRAEKGISSEAYLNWLALSNPDLFKRISVLDEDHTYSRRFIVLPESSISVEEINHLLLQLESNGLLSRIFSRYGQPTPPLN